MDNNNDDLALIVPTGDIDQELLERLADVLSERYGIPFGITDPAEIPEEAYDPKRGQYLSSAILERLSEDHDAIKILGVIDRDLFVPGLNFVFGEAEISGKSTIISLTRLRQSYYGLPEDEDRFFDRAAKEAVHELGHSFGLRHCADPGCVMYFSNNMADTDRKSSEFCPRCEKSL